MMLSILIPTIEERHEQQLALVDLLLDQIEKFELEKDIEIVTLSDNRETTIGAKRNQLLQMAKGKYICFFDDDDLPGINYIYQIMQGVLSEVDCCSLRGIITWDGQNAETFEHSIKYKEYTTTSNPIKYERYPNHLNCIKKEIAIQFKFPEINHGEDTDWATQIFKSGLIKTEHYINEIIYQYQYIPNK